MRNTAAEATAPLLTPIQKTNSTAACAASVTNGVPRDDRSAKRPPPQLPTVSLGLNKTASQATPAPESPASSTIIIVGSGGEEAAGTIADQRFVDWCPAKSPFALVSGSRAGSAAISLSGQFGTVAAVRDLCGISLLTPARCRLKQELHKRNDGHSHTTGLRRDRSSDTTPFRFVIHGSHDTT